MYVYIYICMYVCMCIYVKNFVRGQIKGEKCALFSINKVQLRGEECFTKCFMKLPKLNKLCKECSHLCKQHHLECFYIRMYQRL